MKTYEQMARGRSRSFGAIVTLGMMSAGGLVSMLLGTSLPVGTTVVILIALSVNTFIWLHQNPTLKQLERRRAKSQGSIGRTPR